MSSSADEMKPSVRSLFTSRLEMVEARQSWQTLLAPDEAPGSAIPFLLPMMLEFLEEGTVVREEIEEEDEQYGGVKSENSERAFIYSEDCWESWP